MTIEPITHANGISAIYDQREALNRMDTGQPQQPSGEGEPSGASAFEIAPAADHSVATADPAVTGSSPSPDGRPEPATEETTMEKTASTRDSLIAEIRAYANAHDGRPPSSAFTPGNTIYRHAKKLGLVYADLVRAAGCPTNGKPKPRTEKPAVPPPVAETNGTTPQGIAELAARFEETATALEIVQEDYEAARAAFFAHPLIAKES